jgi:surfeit locus 1 family protein
MTAIFNWKVALFSLVFLMIFLRLGFWQIERSHEKRDIIVQQQQLYQSDAADFVTGLPSGTPVELNGEYDNSHTLLYDNRVLEGVVGFEVLQPFIETSTGQTVLINRGFVAMGRTRDEPVVIPPLASTTRAIGHIYETRAPADEARSDGPSSGSRWPRIVQTSHPQTLQTLMAKPLFPQIVRLAEDDTNALPRYWPVTTILPEKHTGYAIQWFLMAFAVLVAFGCFTIRRPEPDGGLPGEPEPPTRDTVDE